MGHVSRRRFVGGVMAGALVAGASRLAPGGLPGVRADDGGSDLLENRMASDHAWSEFLAGHDLLWNRIPSAWVDGPFLGNGLLGAIAFQPAPGGSIELLVGHTEVQDHRPEFGPVFGLARLPVGNLVLETAGSPTGVSWRLDLWNAELSGTVTTTAGQLQLRALVHDQRSVLLVHVVPSEGERGF